MNRSIIDNPNRELTDAETIEQLMPLVSEGSQLLAINRKERLVLLKHDNDDLESWSYDVSNTNVIEGGGWKPKLEHYFRGSTHHQMRDFRELFGSKPVGTLKRFQSDTELLYVNVHRVGKRRKFIDDIGNVFVKAFSKTWKFPEQVSY